MQRGEGQPIIVKPVFFAEINEQESGKQASKDDAIKVREETDDSQPKNQTREMAERKRKGKEIKQQEREEKSKKVRITKVQQMEPIQIIDFDEDEEVFKKLSSRNIPKMFTETMKA